ncbi:hypothetical protein HPP92_010115 [Vanilla planifolia]|uniref:Uncharacterized protein n=1 Tax=Vanilla planifolia TaxID=51239 RepID=A0A835UYZ4_VANPL|nr:hypothetical protein HPP92_010115 [Vanilla planifolia]
MKAGEKATGTTTGIPSSSTGGGGGGQKTLKKGPWTAAEDVILTEYVNKHGERNWNSVQKNSNLLRCGKSCRLRWTNHLRPNLKKGSFSHKEQMLILQLQAQHSNKWARMATQLPGRTDNAIKNFWNTRVKRWQRANLCVYPPEIQPTINNSQGPSAPKIAASPPETAALTKGKQHHLSAAAPSHHSQVISASYSPAGAAITTPYQRPFGTLLQDTTRVKNLSFQFGPSPVPPWAAPPFVDSPSPSQYVQSSFGISSQPPVLESPFYSLIMELPSSQLFCPPGGEQLPTLTPGNSGLLDVLLPDHHGVEEPFINICNSSDYDSSIGTHARDEMDVETTLASTMNQDNSMLFDVVLQAASLSRSFPTWWTNSNNSSEYFNGLQPSVPHDDDIELEMQQLGSTAFMSPADYDSVLCSRSCGDLPNWG